MNTGKVLFFTAVLLALGGRAQTVKVDSRDAGVPGARHENAICAYFETLRRPDGAYAAENGTAMSRVIRECFTGLVAQRPEGQDGGSCRFLELAKSADVHLSRGWRFNRSECNERPATK